MSHASAVEALLFAALDAALTRLLAMDPQAAKLVELRHFAGLSSLGRRKPKCGSAGVAAPVSFLGRLCGEVEPPLALLIFLTTRFPCQSPLICGRP